MFDMGIQHTMMAVLGIREVRRVELPDPPAIAPHPFSQDIELCALLFECLSFATFLLHLCLLDADGRVTAEASKSENAAGDLTRIRAMLHAFAQDYPRTGLARVFVQDDAGMAALVAFPGENQFVAVADKSAPLGAVSMTIGKITARLIQKLESSSARG
jgi:hypothetical protein